MREHSSLIHWVPNNRPRLELNPPGLFPFVLARLLDHEVQRLEPHARPAPTEPNDEFNVAMQQARLALPHVRAAAEYIFGPSSRADGVKSSFTYPLTLVGTSSSGPVRYVMHLEDMRGGVQIQMYRLDSAPAAWTDPCARVPGSVELSSAQLAALKTSIVEFLDLIGASRAGAICPFVDAIRSDLLLYGYQDGSFFVRDYADTEAFERALADVTGRIAREQEQHREQFIETLLRSCGDSSIAG